MLSYGETCMISSQLRQEVCEPVLPLIWTIPSIEVCCQRGWQLQLLGILLIDRALQGLQHEDPTAAAGVRRAVASRDA